MPLLSDGLFLPALLIAASGWLVPRILATFFPEGVAPLFLNAFLSTLLLFAISSAFFLCLYLWQGAPMAEILAEGIVSNIVFFGRLGLIAAMIWAPIMVLSVAGLPRKWTKETW